MARWIGLDLGMARTGIAVTDRDAMIASPLETVATKDLLSRLQALVNEESCAGFVVGDPGPLADSAPLIAQWEQRLKKAFPGKTIRKVDESFSSREARSAMVAGGMKKSRRQEKGAMDRVAAAIILQRFLEEQESGDRPGFPGFLG